MAVAVSTAPQVPRGKMISMQESLAPRKVLNVVGIVLAGVAGVATLAFVGLAVPAEFLPLALTISLTLMLYRTWLVALRPPLRQRQVAFWVSLAFTFVLVAVSPLAGIYAFLGYFDAPALFQSKLRWIAMTLVAASVALSQSGGLVSPIASWGLFAVFLAVNLGITVLVHFMERSRERFVTKLNETIAELRASEARNAALQQQLLQQARDAGIEDERGRLSREIHDTVAQGLVATITQLEAADPEAPDREERIKRAETSAREALAEARRAVHALASPRLDEVTMPVALKALTRQVGAGAGLDTRFDVDGEPAVTLGDAELLRVAQEALSNVVRHAEAEQVAVTLSYLPDEVRLDVRDDGRGFDVQSSTAGHGLSGMRQRVTALGGTLDIESERGGGCAVSAAVPR